MQNKKNISLLQMTLTFILALCLVLSNILVAKPINLFGIPQLANTCSIFTFPVTYVLSDIFSEVYGYKWSRITANFAFAGTALCSVFFTLMIAVPGSASWHEQQALISILGSTPRIAISSIVAFWVGDFVNDVIFQRMKQKHNGAKKWFCFRAIFSSIIGKYADGLIFTFFGLPFLPLRTKISMVLTCPLVQTILEILLLPLTVALMEKIKKTEEKVDV